MRRLIIWTAAIVVTATGAQAATVSPTSYDMINGGSGSYTYHDSSYTGAGSVTTNYSSLSGGSGELTDGVIATQNWNATPAPYVGWSNQNPTITFHFDQAYAFNSVTLYLDDSNGTGGVSYASSIDVNGSHNFALSDPAGAAPSPAVLNVTGLFGPTDTLTVKINRSTAWLMLSEVTFDVETSVVPLPASGLMLLGGIAALTRRRKRR